MKKVISLVMVLCMLLGTLAFNVSADTASITVAVGSVKNGDVYAEGANIVLTATTNAGNISHIDFKANGDKIPGTLIGGEGSIIWYAPAAGKYQITAEVYCVGNENVAAVSAPVTVTVTGDADITSLVNMNGTLDEIVTNDWIAREASEDYALLGQNSLKVSNLVSSSGLSVDTPSITASSTYNPYIYIPVYNAGTEAIGCHVITYTTDEANASYIISRRHSGSDLGSSSSYMTLNPGWNLAFVEHGHANYYKTIESVSLITYGYGLADGYWDEAHENAQLYIGGVYVSETKFSDMAAFTAVGTSIPNGKTNVCNELKKYRINFSESIGSAASDAVKVVNVTDSTEDAEATVAAEITAGVDYIDVSFANAPLAMGKDYKVVLGANKVANVYGKGNTAAEYTFSTIADSCTAAEPIPSVTYPTSGSDVSVNTALAAKVIFSGNVTNVEFFDGDTSLGVATKYTGNEYVLKPATALSEGEHTITVKATTSAGVYTSDAIIVNACAAGEYKLYGISEGQRVIVNDKLYHEVSVIDADTTAPTVKAGISTIPNATNVEKVVFDLEGEEYVDGDAPFTYKLPIKKLGTNSLTVSIYDIFGSVSTETVTFDAVYGAVSTLSTNDGSTAPAFAATSGTVESVESPYTGDALSGNVIAVTTKTSTTDYIVFGSAPVDTNTKLVRIEFDYRSNSSVRAYWQLWTSVNTTNVAHATNNKGAFLEDHHNDTAIPTSKTVHIAADIDVSTGLIVVYVDGVEYFRKTSASMVTEGTDGNGSKLIALRLYPYAWSSNKTLYVDNLKFTTYSALTDSVIFSDGSTVSCINPASATSNVEFDVINAGYTDATKTKLTSAVKDSVTVLPGKIFSKTYSSIGEVSRIYVWDKNLAPLAK